MYNVMKYMYYNIYTVYSHLYNKMRFFAITASLLLACQAGAFAPSVRGVRSTSLNAETLEGWKIKGNIKPVNNFILIKKALDQKETDSGILLSNQVG